MTALAKKLYDINQFTAQLHKKSKKWIVEGGSASELFNSIEREIFSNKYLPSFPAMIAVNEVAAHWTSFLEDDYVFQRGDIVKVDFGASDEGYIADMAYTIVVGGLESIENDTTREQIKTLMIANQEALDMAIKVSNVGVCMSDIGNAVHTTAKKYGCDTIHNLSGHQIMRNILHAGLTVPNFKSGDTSIIKSETHLAIEPFLTYGQPKIVERGVSNILKLQLTKPTRDIIAKQILDVIKEHFSHLPFSKRWLVEGIEEELGRECVIWKTFTKSKVIRAIQSLKQSGHLIEYGRLVSASGDIITQYEHSVWYEEINGGKKKVVMTHLEEE